MAKTASPDKMRRKAYERELKSCSRWYEHHTHLLGQVPYAPLKMRDPSARLIPEPFGHG